MIPVALATVIGLVLLWPSEVVAIQPYECGGSAPGVSGDAATQTCAMAILTMEDGPEANENVRVEPPPDVYAAGVEPGVRLLLSRAPGNGDPDQFYSFSDFARGFPIAALALAFAVAVIVVARMRGLDSTLGLSFAFVVLLKFMLPALLAGSSPVPIGLVGSSAIMLVALYLAQGFSARTTTALLGTLFGLGMVTALGAIG